ncbi:MAG TPA: histidine phosphatase family protein [Nocardioidaceae bacterium]|nr:histidine phosphatase family protein [Nocardioidaceae bacterium]
MTRRTLVLIRHAKSDWSGDEPDHERPLAKRGERQAPEAGAWIAANLELDLAVVSTAARAHATWRLVAAQLDRQPAVAFDDRVYAASSRTLLEIVRELPDTATTVAMVGHNPGLEGLVTLLTGQWQPMPTSAVAVIDLEGRWADAGAGASLRTAGRPPGHT